MSKPSDCFVDALHGGGSASVECQCGKLHLCPDNDDYDFDGEPGSWKEYCEAEYSKHPDTVVLSYGYDAVTYKEIDGKSYAYGCDCWESIARYEEWIWHNRSLISRYVNSRIEQMAKEAEHEKLMNLLKDDIRY